jgi:hypothetical protein
MSATIGMKKLLATAALSAGMLLAVAGTAGAEARQGQRVQRQALASARTTAAATTRATAAETPAAEAPRCRAGNTKRPSYTECDRGQRRLTPPPPPVVAENE